MKVLQLSRDLSAGELRMKAGHAYVMADPIAAQIANQFKMQVKKFEMFEPHYRPYMGQNLDGKRIVLWRTGGFGDILFITPIVAYLKTKYPTCRIAVATSERFRDVWTNNPCIDPFTSSFSLPIPLDFVKKHDYIGIFEGTIESFKGSDQYCAIDSFSFNLGIFDMPMELKKPRYYLRDSEINVAKNKVRAAFDGFNILTTPYIVFQWKSSSKLRDYPYEKLIAAMQRIQQLTGHKILILTHPNYKVQIENEIQTAKDFVLPSKELDYLNLAGVTNYRESAAVLAYSAGLVGIDSSLTHLAAAFSVPSVTVYGPFKAEWRTVYNRNNISLQKQAVCPHAPCAYHTPPDKQDGLPLDLCTDHGNLPQFSQDKFCRVMSAVTVDEIVSAYMKLYEMQKTETLPEKRMYQCAL